MSHHNDWCEIHRKNNCWCDRIPKEAQDILYKEYLNKEKEKKKQSNKKEYFV